MKSGAIQTTRPPCTQALATRDQGNPIHYFGKLARSRFQGNPDSEKSGQPALYYFSDPARYGFLRVTLQRNSH
jgi:hypothetical protein